jgi:hypothetical protein
MSWGINAIGSLAGIAICVGFLGCSGETGQGEDSPEEAETALQGEKAIKRELWYREPFALDQEAEIQVTTTLSDGPAVDVYVMSEAGLNRWDTIVAKGQETADPTFEHYPALGLEGMSSSFTSAWTTLAPGTYYLVIDNTSYGGTAPPQSRKNDIAIVAYKVEVR